MVKQQTWVQPRHKVTYPLIRFFLKPFVQLKYHITAEPFPADSDRPYLVIFNHQTGFDQFFPLLVFRQPLYFIASEDVLSMGWISRALSWLVAPLPSKKQTTDLKAVKN